MLSARIFPVYAKIMVVLPPSGFAFPTSAIKIVKGIVFHRKEFV
jgi:hypothetical protein